MTQPRKPPAVEFAGVHKWYGAFHVLRDIHLHIETGERIVVCGPSGSGKSTLIRCVNRLEEHHRGALRVNGVELSGAEAQIDRVRREVGMVFQQFNLFPHLTVLQNCTLAPIWASVRDEPSRSGSTRFCAARKGADRRSGAQISRRVVGGPAAARRHRPRAVHES